MSELITTSISLTKSQLDWLYTQKKETGQSLASMIRRGIALLKREHNANEYGKDFFEMVQKKVEEKNK